jgi:outer membrane protein TolC/ABC-type uncharacterized transport system substrate-binding protein
MRAKELAIGPLRTLLCSLVAAALPVTAAQAVDSFRVGFFEGGAYPNNTEFRNLYREQLKAMAPEGFEVIFDPDGFQSAGWDREASRAAARSLSANRALDLVVATGPWTVEDLLAAGFDRPIVAALRFDPAAEGLLDAQGRPLYDNLTVRVRPGKVGNDLRMLAALTPIKKLGFLYFPNGDESGMVVEQLSGAAEAFGMELSTADGYDRKGTFAYFKAYQSLGRVDAVYLPPLWGCDSDKIRQFYAMLARDKVIAFSSEGAYHALRGALAAGSAESALEVAHYQAWKTARIMAGVVPADLPTHLEDTPRLTVNESVARELGLDLNFTTGPGLYVIEGPPSDNVERLTVIDAVSLALGQNQSLQAARSRLEAARDKVGESAAGYLPQLTLSGSALRYDRNTLNNHPRYDRTRYRAGLEVRQELLSFDILEDIRTASRRSDLVENEARRAALDLELAVTAAFLDVFLAEQTRQLDRSQLSNADDCYRLAKLKLELDENSAAEVWRFEEETLRTAADLRRAEARVRIARIVLNTLIGRPGDYPFVVDWQHFTNERFFREQFALDLFKETSGQWRRSIWAILDKLAETNPEITGEELGIAVGKAELARNRAGWWPRIGFVAGLEMANELTERTDWQESNPTWSLGATLDFPLYLGGQRSRERSRLQAELAAREASRDQTRLEAESELRIAFEELSSRADEFPALARAAGLALDYIPAVESDFAAGTCERTILLDALTSYRRSSLEAITVQAEYFLNVARLVRATGVSPNELNRAPGDQWLRWLAGDRK